MATYKSIKYLVPVEAVEHTDSINALNDVDTVTAAPTDGQTIKWNGTNWVPSNITEEEASGTQKALFGFGEAADYNVTSVTNLVSSTGVVASDTTGVGAGRRSPAAAGFGGDKAIFGFGYENYEVSNTISLVSNTGVVASDTSSAAGVGNKAQLAAAGYGGDKAIFGFGNSDGSSITNITNLVSNTGVVASDTTGVGTARNELAGTGYGGDKAIFGFGDTSSSATNTTNLVSNVGVVATDITAPGGSDRFSLAACSYGGDKALFGFGYWSNAVKLVSNTGVVSSNTTGAGTERRLLAAAGYGGDKGIFGFGNDDEIDDWQVNITNLVSNTGVVASDTTGVGTARVSLAAAGYSTTA